MPNIWKLAVNGIGNITSAVIKVAYYTRTKVFLELYPPSMNVVIEPPAATPEIGAVRVKNKKNSSAVCLSIKSTFLT